MGTRSLLRNARHRTMITPVNPLRLRLIDISPSYRKVCRSFEIILGWVLFTGLEFKSNVLCKLISPKKHSIWYKLNLKNTELHRAARTPMDERERTYSREPLLRTIFFYSRHLKIERRRPTCNENI